MDIAVEAVAGSGNRSTRGVDCFCVAYNIDFLFAIVFRIFFSTLQINMMNEKQSKDGHARPCAASHCCVVTAQGESL